MYGGRVRDADADVAPDERLCAGDRGDDATDSANPANPVVSGSCARDRDDDPDCLADVLDSRDHNSGALVVPVREDVGRVAVGLLPDGTSLLFLLAPHVQ